VIRREVQTWIGNRFRKEKESCDSSLEDNTKEIKKGNLLNSEE